MFDFSYWYFFILALFGAIVANATGAGGGVVFVPAFSILGIEDHSIVATSFAIQCFGMTAGMIAWRGFARLQATHPEKNAVWDKYWFYVLIFALPSVVGVLIGQYLFLVDQPSSIKLLFKYFSYLFVLSILATTWFIVNKPTTISRLTSPSIGLLAGFALVGLVGGMVTAWLSIGVGELVAVTLIFSRFPVRMAVGVAVSVSAISVWVGIQKYLWLEPYIYWQILLFAAPAAMLGGSVARKVATLFSPVQLKVFIALWILISAIAM